jgi:CRP-like cAMP-binding protein
MEDVRATEISSGYTEITDRQIGGHVRNDPGACEPVKVIRVLRYHDIVRTGHDSRSCHFLETGFACSYKLLRDGRRQITTIHIPGDLIDFTKLASRRDYAIAARTSCKVAAVAHETLRAAMHRNPKFAEHLWHRELIGAATQREWLVCLGRRTALAGMAHLLCELLTRLQQVGLANGYACRLPVRQAEFADILGLSTVHVNRTVQHLRQTRMISWNGDALVIKDPEGLIQLAEFDASYLQVLPQGACLTSLDLVMSEMKDAPQWAAAHNNGEFHGRLCEGRVA